MNTSKFFFVLTLFIWMLLVPACGKTPTSIPVLEVPTLSPTTELAFTPTVTLTPIPSATNSPTPTLTPIPTLPIDEAKAMVLSLYKNNGNCKFPCWWGIEPGETSWMITRNFLASFAERISPPSTSDFFGKTKGYGVYFPIDTQDGNQLFLGIKEQDDVVRFIITGVNEEFERANNSKKYFLYSLLAEYGSPDQVYLYTQPYTPNDSYPFSVTLFYEKQRFAIIYYEHGTLQNDQIRGCFENDFSFLSWAPDTITELGDLTKVGMTPEDIGQYRSLNEVTELDLASFYETFKNPSTPFCLETSIELWQ